MRKISILLVAAALVCFAPAFVSAQLCSPGECMVNPGVRNNMGTMSTMMADMHQMLKSGKLNSTQQTHMLKMMDQMSGIMKDMGSPEGPQKEAMLQQQLQQLQKELHDLKTQVSKN
jgi:hypothetical protein